jgi:radical SAM-linked protein
MTEHATERSSADQPTVSRHRYRIRFSKLGKIRFTSHRDVARLWERALRRAAVPVAYSEGFSPHPKLSFGLALSTSHESLGEYLDVEVTESLGDPLDVGALITRLDPGLPIGLDVQAAAEIAPGTPSLQQVVTCCTWRIGIQGHGCRQLAERVDDVLRADSIVVTRERKGQQVIDDVRPAIVALDISGDAEVVADLATQPRGLRPSELVAALTCGNGDLEEDRVMRLHQWLSIDGAREEPLPLPLDATPTPYATARAA